MIKFDIDIFRDFVYQLVGSIYNVHNELGPGLNEYIYQEALAIELEEQNIVFEREKQISLTYRNRPLEATYRLDFYCACSTVVECKSVEQLTHNHRAQLFNYMRLVKAPIGILVNFAPKSAVVERYFYNDETKEICDVNGDVLSHYDVQSNRKKYNPILPVV